MTRPVHASSSRICYVRGIVKNILCLIFASALLVGCGTAGPGSEAKQEAPAAATGGSGSVAAIRKYPMHGKVVAVNPDKTVRIEAGPIGDYMGAMTMNYTVRNDADRAKLTEGTTFDATLYVTPDNDWVGDVTPVPAK
jgi:Cu/Ag efflux protein CusF